MELFDIQYNQNEDGNLQIDFQNNNPDFKKFYDTTRLIVDRRPLNIEGHQVFNCAVSWYGHDDCAMFNERTRKYESLRAQEYSEILAELDLYLLQTDKDYCNMVMNGLLDKQRVEKYLERGLQETPDLPCGKYIGGVYKTERGYGKYFSEDVGRASHNSGLMIEKRKKHIGLF